MQTQVSTLSHVPTDFYASKYHSRSQTAQPECHLLVVQGGGGEGWGEGMRAAFVVRRDFVLQLWHLMSFGVPLISYEGG